MIISNVNKEKTSNVKVVGAIRSISDNNITVYTGDVYRGFLLIEQLLKRELDITLKIHIVFNT